MEDSEDYRKQNKGYLKCPNKKCQMKIGIFNKRGL